MRRTLKGTDCHTNSTLNLKIKVLRAVKLFPLMHIINTI